MPAQGRRSNVNDRFRPFSSGQMARRISAAEQKRIDDLAAARKEGERREAEATLARKILVKDTREYIAHRKEAKAKGRKPRLARKPVREHLRLMQRVGNTGRDNPRKKK